MHAAVLSPGSRQTHATPAASEGSRPDCRHTVNMPGTRTPSGGYRLESITKEVHFILTAL